ncbi:unnamed protein product, partial [Scytosiphon promiscuus]
AATRTALKFGAPRSGLGNALAAGVIRRQVSPLPTREDAEGAGASGAAAPAASAPASAPISAVTAASAAAATAAAAGPVDMPAVVGAVGTVALERLADSLETVSCPPWINSTAAGQHKRKRKLSRMRLLHQMWSSTGYTAAAAETASRAEGAQQGGAGVGGGAVGR